MTRSRLAAPLTLIGMLLAHPPPPSRWRAAMRRPTASTPITSFTAAAIRWWCCTAPTCRRRRCGRWSSGWRSTGRCWSMDLQGHGPHGAMPTGRSPTKAWPIDVDALMATLDTGAGRRVRLLDGRRRRLAAGASATPDRIPAPCRRLGLDRPRRRLSGALGEGGADHPGRPSPARPWEAEYKAVRPGPRRLFDVFFFFFFFSWWRSWSP